MTSAMIRRRSALGYVLLASAALLQGQQTDTPTAPSLSADAKLVNVPVVVRDKKGAPLNTLKKEDFTLQIDQHPQTIRYFDLDGDLPLTLGLLVDTAPTLRNELDDERTASAAFLETMLKPGRNGQPNDKAFVIQFGTQTELLQDLTDSRPKLQAALKEIETSAPDPAEANEKDTDEEGRRIRRGGNVLYDASFLAADEIMKKQKGRKAMILLTDGVDRNSKETLATAIETAQRGDTTLYAIYFRGEEPRSQNTNRPNNGGQRGGGYPGGGYPGGGYPGGGYPGGGYPGGGGGYPGGGNGGGGNGGGGNKTPTRPVHSNIDGKKVLERMTQETGGRLFEASKKEPLAEIYRQIGEELRTQYRLGFTPDEDRARSGYHLIDLTLTDKKYKGYAVQTRDGYYAGK